MMPNILFLLTMFHLLSIIACGQYNKSCSNSTECSLSPEVCMDGLCQCSPDFRYSLELDLCQYFHCNESSDCQSTDPNRVCWKGECLCADQYHQDHNNGRKCMPGPEPYEQYCSSQSECRPAGERCVDYQCQCEPDYHYVVGNGSMYCQLFNCTADDLCGTGVDVHRVCDPSRGVCVCPDGYHQDLDNGGKCEADNTISNVLKFVLVPVFIFLAIFFMFAARDAYKKKKLRQLRDK